LTNCWMVRGRMRRPKTLAAFSREEHARAHALLASKVAGMMGRKLEEGDWSFVYHTAKGIPYSGWSNLNIDVAYGALGVEHKMLCVSSKVSVLENCGTRLMHPAATRSVRIPSTEEDPTLAARDVLHQYAELIESRRQQIGQNSPGVSPDLRVGWLLWQQTLREFLYFEQEMLPPNPDDYWAEWKQSGGGSRKTSKNLWVYEVETGIKRYSITTAAGAKIQPYFDVPAPNDANLYYFLVQGERVEREVVRVWITRTTALLLKQMLGALDKDVISSAIVIAAKEIAETGEVEETGKAFAEFDLAEPILLTAQAYDMLTQTFAGVSDEHT
jgi:hypothetical protein